ncbi:PGF-CTERM sorting domain-containing protein [Natronobiforma cellulositropha]|uniref:PGF-CTERM sorting domain-containing protein n=1 Tax=Natronobiforma cellulositropha TaxID=1679076 RepID=UPI0021D5854F|nr:PGF-CTERM sorting domain-containing protein [Natronobiforma cellulositropha]
MLTDSHPPRSPVPLAVGFVLLVALLGVTATVAGGVAAGTLLTVDPAASSALALGEDDSADEKNATPPLEDAYTEAVPDRDDPYFEAEAADGSWISYVNPRDRYRQPYLGDGSGKLCVTLLNEDGEVIVGESVPGTTVTVPTGDSLSWHSFADPMTVEYPLTEHYDRPLDADQFGTTADLPQGDGLLDAHCIEFHGLPEDGTVEYGEPEISGPYADWIEIVGYVQQTHQAWDTNVDPIDDAVGYEEVGGWTYQTDASHGQAVIVLQLDPPAEADADDDADEGAADDERGDDRDDDSTGVDDDALETPDGTNASGDDESDDSASESMPGFGAIAAAVVLVLVATLAVVSARRP